MKHENVLIWLLSVCGALLSLNIALGGWIGNKVYDKVNVIGNYVQALDRNDGIQDTRISELERRLNAPRPGPIADKRPAFGVRLP